MALRYETCMICGGIGYKKIFTVSDYKHSKESFDIMECDHCRFRWTANPPEEDQIGPYYDNPNYVSHSNTNQGLVFGLYQRVRRIMMNFKSGTIQENSQGKNLLDVGCGTGHFLNHMKQASYTVYGIEPAAPAREFCKSNFGIEVHEPSALFSDQWNQKMDSITLWHVLEHLYKPDQYLSEFYKKLTSSGVLYIAVPNHQSTDASYYQNYWTGYDVPRHLWHFGPDHIKQWVESHGFKLIKSKRMSFDAFYVSILSEQDQKSKLPFIKGMLVGCFSFLKSLFDKNKTSSLLYIFKKVKKETA